MKYTEVEYKIIKYCEDHANEIYKDTINVLSNKIFVAPSTISKLSRKMGYNSFIEFKLDFQLKYEVNQTVITSNEFVDNYIAQLNKSIKEVNLDRVVRVKDMIKNSDEVLLFGIGSSGKSANYLKNNLLRFNINAMQETSFISNSMQLHARSDKHKVLLIIFSHSGKTEEILKSLSDVDTTQFKIAIITSNSSSTLAGLSDEQIIYSINVKKQSPFSNWSYIIQSAICDILLNELTRDIKPKVKLNSQ